MTPCIRSLRAVAIVLVLAGCGGNGDAPVPAAPSEVRVARLTNPVIVTWRHDGTHATGYVVYRSPKDGSGPPLEIGRTPSSAAKKVYTSRHTPTSDETNLRYGVAAAGASALSEIVWNDENEPITAAASCQVQDISADDLDGDGIPNTEELEGWQIFVAPLTASATGVAGQLERDKPVAKTVSSSMFFDDTDGDGLCDWQEHGQAGTDPSSVDTDGDGLADADEVLTWNSNPNDPDSDDDAFAPVLKLIDGEQQLQYVTRASAEPALLDGREACASSAFTCNFKTSPTMADTDGDSYTDFDEIIELGGDFDPLIANLPQLELSLVGTAGLTVDIAYTDSTQQADTRSTSLAEGETDTRQHYNSNVRKTWDKYGQSITTSAGIGPKGFSGSVSMTASEEEGTANTSTSGWSSTTASQSTQTYNDAVQTASQAGRQISGGSISMGVQITNTGQISYALSDLAVTALQRLPQEDSFASIGTLELDSAIGGEQSPFGSIGTGPLSDGTGITLAPGESTGVLQVKTDIAAGNKILDLMANPAVLYFEVGSFMISNAQGVDFDFIAQVTAAQTGAVLIDFGTTVISKRVATNVARVEGKIAGITLGEVMDTLGIKYETAPKVVGETTVTVLTGVQNPDTGEFVRVDDANNRFWVALKTADELAVLPQDFEDIVLEGGGAVYILYATDVDQDGVYLRDELLYGTDDANPDTDGDGLSDFEEIANGWQVTAELPPRYPVAVFSSPIAADADNDGLSDLQEKALGTDPNNPDTDGDLLCDGPGSALNATGICRAGVTADPQPLVPRFAFVDSSPGRYVVDAAADSPIVVGFTLPVLGTSTLRVNSRTRGPVQGTTSFADNGRTMTFTPTNPFMPNEAIEVSLSGETSVDGQPLPDYQYDFRVASPRGLGFSDDYDAGGQIRLNDDTGFRFHTVLSGDFNQDGMLDVAMAGFNPVVGTSWDAVYVAFGNGQSQFDLGQPVRVELAGGPTGLVAGDFNNDGRPDLAATLINVESVVTLLAGTTQGQFDPPTAQSYSLTGAGPVGIATGDFDGDGNLDLVTANRDTGTNTVLLGKGDGTFAAGAEIVSGPTPRAVAVADVDSDGILDIVTPYGSSGAGGLYIQLGNGDGTFRQTGRAQPFTASGYPVAVATGDFNGDGLVDIVTANQGSNDVSLFINADDGTFTPQANLPVAPDPASIYVADFDGNGLLDIATASASPTGPVVSATLLNAQTNATVDSFERLDIGIGLRGTAVVADAFQSNPPGPLQLVVLGFDHPSGYQLVVATQPAPSAD